jgi:hypothetical protein
MTLARHRVEVKLRRADDLVAEDRDEASLAPAACAGATFWRQ